MERGLLEMAGAGKRSLADPIMPVVLTAKGWEYLENNETNLVSKEQAFVAMSFDSELRHIYTNAIAPAIEATGYKPYPVDASPHIDRIDAKIVAGYETLGSLLLM